MFSKKWKPPGEKFGKKEFSALSQNRFDDYLCRIVINKKRLSSKYKNEFKIKPGVLPPWDLQGSLELKGV